MKVTIDGVKYFPARSFGGDADETARAVIRMLISGYYNSLDCNSDGGVPKEFCECSACESYRVAVQFLGGVPKCEEEKILGPLLKSCEV